MVPKLAVKSDDVSSLYSVHPFKVDERSVLGAENTVEFQQIKGTAQNMALRGVRSGRVQLGFAGEEDIRPKMTNAELLLPIFVHFTLIGLWHQRTIPCLSADQFDEALDQRGSGLLRTV